MRVLFSRTRPSLLGPHTKGSQGLVPRRLSRRHSTLSPGTGWGPWVRRHSLVPLRTFPNSSPHPFVFEEETRSGREAHLIVPSSNGSLVQAVPPRPSPFEKRRSRGFGVGGLRRLGLRRMRTVDRTPRTTSNVALSNFTLSVVRSPVARGNKVCATSL